MQDYFDNRKPGRGPLRQSSRGRLEALSDFACILNPTSKRGSRWRFRILCVLAVATALFLYVIRNRLPSASDFADEQMLEERNPLKGRDILQRR